MSVHIAIDELADADAGALDARRSDEIDAHVRQCARCTELRDAIAEVSEALASLPPPSMPPELAARLDGVLAAESKRRASTRPAGASPSPPLSTRARPTLGTFGADLPGRPRSKFILAAAAAGAAAAAVGFAGYFLSASAGLNEPASSAPAVISSSQLGLEAYSIQQRSDLSPHRFSQAWQCSREVTQGRITALTSVVVDGEPALLVYTSKGGTKDVTVVTGCGSGRPSAGPSTTLAR